MHEKKIFGTRSQILDSDEVRKKFILVFEGKNTERIYFEAIDESRNLIGVNSIVDIVYIVKGPNEESWSNPKKILDRVLQNIQESKSGEMSYETLLNLIVAYSSENNVIKSNSSEVHYLWKLLVDICKEKFNVSINDLINKSKLEIVCKDILLALEDCRKDIKGIVDNVPQIIKKRPITYDEQLDKICFIIDRDSKSFRLDQYDYVLETCHKKGFGFYLSNPCFEMWILMHFDEVFEFDKEKLLNNPKNKESTEELSYTEECLVGLLPDYSKHGYKTSKLMTCVDKAIENEKSFCEDESLLKNSIGSRVGILLTEMKSNKI